MSEMSLDAEVYVWQNYADIYLLEREWTYEDPGKQKKDKQEQYWKLIIH